MTSPFAPGQNPGAAPGAAARRGPVALPTPPKGWPIGSYPTYAEAQKAVDFLSDQQFPVQHVTIVGVDLMQVERVTGRLTWPKVLGGGVITGAWLRRANEGITPCWDSSVPTRGRRCSPASSPASSSA